MSGIGFWELVLLTLIGLVVLGPERLPRVANQLGTWLGHARRMTRVMKRQLEDELNLEQQLRLKPPVAEPPSKQLDDTFSPAHDKESVGLGVGDDTRESEASNEAPEAKVEKESS